MQRILVFGQPSREHPRLRAPGVVEVDVGLSLPALLEIPCRLAVAREEQDAGYGHGDVGAGHRIRARD